MRFLIFLLLALPLCVQADQESDFRAARDAVRAGDAARLDKIAQRLKDSPLEPYVTYYQLHLRWGVVATPEIRAFLARTSESPVVDQFRGEWLKYLAQHASWKAFAEEYPHLVSSDDELNCYALQLRAQSDAAAALAEARKLWFRGDEMPDSCTPLFNDAMQQGLISADDVWQRMRLALESNDTTLAQALIKHLPQTQIFPTAELGVAERDPQRYLERTRFENAGRGRRLAAMFALQRLARQSPDIALAQWQRIAGNFPEAEQRYYFGWLGYAGALVHDARALAWFAAAGDDVLNPRQLAWRARAALRAGNWREVWESINAMPLQQQNEDAWRYWKGRALQALGRPAEADELFAGLSGEYNFYGQLAAEELGTVAEAGMTHYQPGAEEIAAVQALPGIQRTLLLYRMDMRVEAAREWAWATRAFSDRQLLVAAEVARRYAMYDRSINAADRTVQLHDFSLRYPVPYRENLQVPLQKHGLEEAWVYGLMRQESRFTINARSDAGAAGLMQIMPQTARWVARRIGMKGYRKGLIHQMDVNIQLGTYYMKSVSQQFDDNPVLASAAYNAGPTRARQWCGTQPLEGAIYIETIPFDETRDYVKKVMSNTLYYSRQFGQTSLSLKQRLGVIQAQNTTSQKKDINER